MILQSTPVLFVDKVEPSEAFFAKLGFERTVSVPEEGETGEVGFVIMMQGGRNDSGLGVMLQTRSSARDDMAEADPALFEDGTGSFLFMSVADIDATAKALQGYEQFLPRRDTFYGATEIGFREPGGHHIVLAQFAANSPEEA